MAIWDWKRAGDRKRPERVRTLPQPPDRYLAKRRPCIAVRHASATSPVVTSLSPARRAASPGVSGKSRVFYPVSYPLSVRGTCHRADATACFSADHHPLTTAASHLANHHGIWCSRSASWACDSHRAVAAERRRDLRSPPGAASLSMAPVIDEGSKGAESWRFGSCSRTEGGRTLGSPRSPFGPGPIHRLVRRQRLPMVYRSPAAETLRQQIPCRSGMP